jgi:hypothetical protein
MEGSNGLPLVPLTYLGFGTPEIARLYYRGEAMKWQQQYYYEEV